MLYITAKSSAPAAVRRSCAAKMSARTRRLNARSAARVDRAARIAKEHKPAPAVCITPVSPAARIAAMLITDDITGRFSARATASSARRVYPRPILTRTDKGYIYVQPDGPARMVATDDGPAYRAPAKPYTGSTVESVPTSYHPGIKLASPTAAPAPLYKSSYKAQHTMQAAAVTPLQNLAGAVACNAVKRRYSDTAVSRFLTLQWDNVRDAKRNDAAETVDNLAIQYEDAAAALDAAETLAKRDAKILGLIEHVRARYIADNTSAEKAALQSVKERITAAEKLDNTTLSDFADVKSAAYMAGYELLKQYAAYLNKKDGKTSKSIDCEELVNSLIARNNAEKEDLQAARAAVEATKDAAKKAGYTRLMDFAPYRDAKAALAKYRRRNLVITMSSAARTYIGGEDHGGKVQAADIDAAARRSKDVQSAENAALYKAVDNAAKEDAYYTAARADILSCVHDKQARAVCSGIMDGLTQTQIARALNISQSKVCRLFVIARADIARAEGYRDNVQCKLYLDAIAARIK